MSDIQRLISSGAVSLQYGDDDEEDEDYEDEDSYYTRRGFGPIWHPPERLVAEDTSKQARRIVLSHYLNRGNCLQRLRRFYKVQG